VPLLKRESASRPSGEWNDDDFDVLADDIVVGRIMKAAAVPEGTSWLWTLAFGHHGDRMPTHSYELPREAALAAFGEELATEVRRVSFLRYSGSGPVCWPDPVGRKD
jgi:hypothetical protein